MKIISLSLLVAKILLYLQYATFGLAGLLFINSFISVKPSFIFKYGYPIEVKHEEKGVLLWNDEPIDVIYEFEKTRVKVNSSSLSKTLNVAQSLFMGMMLTFTIYLSKQFIEFLKSVKDNNVFTLANIARLKTIGIFVIVLGVVKPLFRTIVILLVEDQLSFRLDLSFIFTGLFIYVVSEVLKSGLEIKSENELTI